jgi:hypothetical protein
MPTARQNAGLPPELQELRATGRKLRGPLAKHLAETYPRIVSVRQAKQMLAILDDSLEHARWCLETIKGSQQHFKEPMDPVVLARSITKRKGWEPRLQPSRRKASAILATLAGLLRER